MSVKIDHINIEKGESIMIHQSGSAEFALAVVSLGTGILVSGPMNQQIRDVHFTPEGVQRARQIDAKCLYKLIEKHKTIITRGAEKWIDYEALASAINSFVAYAPGESKA